MSKSNDNPQTTITVAPEATEEAEVVEQKPNFAKKSWNFVKSHKKPAIAVGALVALVGAGALFGGKKADDSTDTEPTPEPLENDYEKDLEELARMEAEVASEG